MPSIMKCMGIWVYIRGWLEFQDSQRAEVTELANTPGWTFPEGGWLTAACYARAVRESELDEIQDTIRRIAALPPPDEDGDHVTGLFLAFHEVDGQQEWQVRDGRLHIARADPRHDYLND